MKIEINSDLLPAVVDLLAAVEVLISHAKEVYPHFESERGVRDIKAAEDAVANVKGHENGF